MKWLLDTNVISEGVRDNPRRAVVEWIAARPPEDVAISLVTLAELLDGAASSRDEVRRQKLTAWIEIQVADAFRDRMLPLTPDVLIEWLRLARRLRGRGKSRDAADLLIAATARIHNLTIATRNVRDFADTGVVVYDPWNAKTNVMDAP